jgi:hypothetical protein
MRFFLSTHWRPVSTFVALSRGLQKAYPVPDELPDSIARAFARLESSTKRTPPPPERRLAIRERQLDARLPTNTGDADRG